MGVFGGVLWDMQDWMTTSVKNLDELDRSQDFCDLFQVSTLSDCKKEYWFAGNFWRLIVSKLNGERHLVFQPHFLRGISCLNGPFAYAYFTSSGTKAKTRCPSGLLFGLAIPDKESAATSRGHGMLVRNARNELAEMCPLCTTSQPCWTVVRRGLIGLFVDNQPITFFVACKAVSGHSPLVCWRNSNPEQYVKW